MRRVWLTCESPVQPKGKNFLGFQSYFNKYCWLVKQMAKFTVHKLALAGFRGCPEWPVRILEVIVPKGNEQTRN